MFKKLSLGLILSAFIFTSCSSKEAVRTPSNEESENFDIYGKDAFIKIDENKNKTAVNFKMCPIPVLNEKDCKQLGQKEFYAKSDLEKLHSKIVKTAAGKFVVIIASTVAAAYMVGKNPADGRGAANLWDTGRNFLTTVVHTAKQGAASAGTGIVAAIILDPGETLTQGKLTRAEYITGSKDLVTQHSKEDLKKAFEGALSVIDNNQL